MWGLTKSQPIDLRTEMKRRANNRTSMLQEFQKSGELTTRDLMRFGPGMSSRLHELRQSHKIVTVYERPGNYRYVYLGSTEEE